MERRISTNGTYAERPKIFLYVLGLTTNAVKSNIFTVNMDSQVVKDLCKLAGYTKGMFPFRNLGVPISSKNNSVVECEMLVEKLVGRVRTGGKEPVLCWKSFNW